VYFIDKPNAQYYFDNPLEMLSQRALDRRTNQNIPLNIDDIPLHLPYIDHVKLTPDLVVKVGQAIGYLLRESQSSQHHNKVVIGKDTRLSGYMLEMALASGLNSMGIHVQLVGPLPTPGIGYLTRTMRANAGIVVSASHNPYHDNGIKIFGPDGYKIADHMEREIERLISEDRLNDFLPPSKDVGRTKRIDDSTGRYIVYVKSTFPLEYTLDGMRIVLDTGTLTLHFYSPLPYFP
jgi:phosphoglucosamine mutase